MMGGFKKGKKVTEVRVFNDLKIFYVFIYLLRQGH